MHLLQKISVVCVCGIISLLVFVNVPIFGQTNTEQALERLEQALENEQGLNSETKAALSDLVGSLRQEHRERGKDKMIDPNEETTKEYIEKTIKEYINENSDSKKPVWEKYLDKIKVYGDIRLRHESDFPDDRRERHRQRTRVRLGVNYNITEEIQIGTRITTGDRDDPNSTHVTFGDVFDRLEISLDRAFIHYKPKWLEGAWITGGKFENPLFYNPIYGENVWDKDVQPEGVAIGYGVTKPIARLQKLKFMAAWYRVLEQGDSNGVIMWNFQAHGEFKLSDVLTSELAISYFLYSDVTPDRDPTLLDDDQGNSLEDDNSDGIDDDFESRFGILNPILTFTYTGLSIPIIFASEYIFNTRAGGENHGWILGLALKPKEWEIYYQWQLIEQDAVFSPFAQDDFFFGTNHQSHIFGFKYLIFRGVEVHIFALVSRPDSGDNNYDWRFRSDLNISF